MTVRATPCSTCIYRSDLPWRVERLEDEIRGPNMRGHFLTSRACHHHRDGGTVCRGFWNRHRDHFTAGQLAQRLNLVTFTDAGETS